ncbi:hypothetical protein MRX96_009004 [Rhipicephalus microplus]
MQDCRLRLCPTGPECTLGIAAGRPHLTARIPGRHEWVPKARHSAGSAALSKPREAIAAAAPERDDPVIARRFPRSNGLSACVYVCALTGSRGLALDTRSEARVVVKGSVCWRDPDFPWSVTSFFFALL